MLPALPRVCTYTAALGHVRAIQHCCWRLICFISQQAEHVSADVNHIRYRIKPTKLYHQAQARQKKKTKKHKLASHPLHTQNVALLAFVVGVLTCCKHMCSHTASTLRGWVGGCRAPALHPRTSPSMQCGRRAYAGARSILNSHALEPRRLNQSLTWSDGSWAQTSFATS